MKTLELLVDRKYKKSEYTIGILYIDGKYFSETLEDCDRGLKSVMSDTEFKFRKIYGKTAIPTGTYDIRMTYSPKFKDRPWGKKYGGKVIQIMDVRGFTGVRIHPGNTAADTLGCILLGRNLEKGKVLYSTDYYYKLLDNYIIPALQRGENVHITIK